MARSFTAARSGAKAPFSSASYSSGPKPNGEQKEPGTGRKQRKKKKSAQDGTLLSAVKALDERPRGKSKVTNATVESNEPVSMGGGRKRRTATAAAAEETAMQGLNVYEYTPDPVKRSRQESSKFELTRDEAAGAGGSSRGKGRGLKGRNPLNDGSDDDDASADDGDDMARRIRKAARMIASDQLMNFDEDEELDGGSEEVDSDAAWNGSEGTDEERWGDAMRVLRKGEGVKKKKGKGREDKVRWSASFVRRGSRCL